MITVVTAGRFVAPRTQNLKKRFGVGAATPPTRSDVSPVARAARSLGEDAQAREAEDGGQQRQCGNHRHADRGGPDCAHHGEEGDARVTLRPSRAIITVMPANTTAEPAVAPRARPTDSGTEIPARS